MTATLQDWETARGEVCSECGQETLRIREGLCPQCYNRKKMEQDIRFEERATRRSYRARLRAGTVSLAELREGR
jgi:NMD protein affecting ribosome stability and mRNA decay